MRFIAHSPEDMADMYGRLADNEERWAANARKAADKSRCEARASAFRECEAIARDTVIQGEE